MTDIKRIPIEEFRANGYLQEVNRRCLHPVGMALEATIVEPEGWSDDNQRVKALADAIAEDNGWDAEDDYAEALDQAVFTFNTIYPPGSQHLSGVWDYRDDPEGMLFDPQMVKQACIDAWNELADSKLKARDATGECVHGIQLSTEELALIGDGKGGS